MTEQQVPQVSAMVGQLVTHQSAFNALPKEDRQFVFQQPKVAIEVMVTAIRNRPKELVEERTYKILCPVAPKPVERRPFKANDTFFSKSSGVKIVSHGSNFTAWFTGKVEEDVPEGILVPFTLTKSAYDNEIITDLGGEEKAETTLTEIWRLMERQVNGGEGVLLTNGYANVFYVRDREGVLRAVNVSWLDVGWGADAYALGAFRWGGGYQVFSRNS